MEGKFDTETKEIHATLDFHELLSIPLMQSMPVGGGDRQLIASGPNIAHYIWRYIYKEIKERAPQIFEKVNPIKITLTFDTEKQAFVVIASEDYGDFNVFSGEN